RALLRQAPAGAGAGFAVQQVHRVDGDHRCRRGDHQLHPRDGIDLFSEDEPRVGVVVGTGPSLTVAQLHQVSHLRKFGANLTYRLGVDVALGCNHQFWRHYAEDAARHVNVVKWTTRPELRGKYPWLNYIEERWE